MRVSGFLEPLEQGVCFAGLFLHSQADNQVCPALFQAEAFHPSKALFEIALREGQLQLAEVRLSEQVVGLRLQLAAGGLPSGFMRAADGARGASLEEVGFGRGEVFSHPRGICPAAPGVSLQRRA